VLRRIKISNFALVIRRKGQGAHRHIYNRGKIDYYYNVETGKRTRIYYYNSVVVIVFDRLIPPSKDERDTNCRNELLFKSLIVLQYSTPTRSFAAVQEFLFVIIFIHSFPKNHNRFLFPAFHTLHPSTSSTVFKSGNIFENPMHAYHRKSSTK